MRSTMITERFLMILMLLALPLHVSSATFRVVVGPKGGTTCIFDYPTSPLSPADVRSLYQCTSIIFQSVLSRRHLHSIWEMFDYFNPYPHPGLHELRIEHIESPLFNAVLATLLSGRVRVQIHQVVINAWGSIDRHSLPPIQYCRPNLHRLMIPQCQLSDQMAKEMRLLLPGMEIISALSASGPASAQRSAMTPKPPSSKTQSVASGKKSATISGFGIESAPYYPGLVNMGNTCYLNSVVQTLFYLRPFRKSIFRTTLSVGTITNGLRNLFANLYERIEKGEWAVIRPTGFVPLVGRLWNQERVNEQNDAPEFMEWLLRRINEETGGSAGITNLYQGRLRKEISCTKVKCQSISHDLFQEVQLPFDEPDTRRSIISLQQMFRNYFAVNHFIGENQYETDNFGKQDAVERHVVVDLPPVLNINLRRRMYTANGGHSKVESRVEIPLEIDLEAMNIPIDRGIYKGSTKYHLHGYSAGHYFAVIKTGDNRWTMFDDSHVIDRIDIGHWSRSERVQSDVYQMMFVR